MNKKYAFVSAVCLIVLAASACAAPAPTPSNNTGPTTQPGAPSTSTVTGTPVVNPGIPTTGNGVSQGTAPAAAPVAQGNFGVGTSYVSAPAINSQYQNSGILVTGMGQVTATPDMATLQIGVSAQAANVATAQTNAANAMNAVMAALKSKGIADKDIQTVGFNINPQYDYKSGTGVITGYQVSNTVTVTVRAVANVSSVIDTSVAAGGNYIVINSISFGVSDPTPYMKQARQLAVADALAKATQLAQFGNVTMGKPVFITESSGYYPSSPVYYGAAVPAAAPSTPINPGTTQISVSVDIIYAIQ